VLSHQFLCALILARSFVLCRTAGRFVLAHLTRPVTSNYSTLLCVAVSIDEDAAGLYYRYAFDLGSQSLLTSLNLATWPSSNSYILTADTRAATTAMLRSELNLELNTQVGTGQKHRGMALFQEVASEAQGGC